jgi:hypothetical protein
MLGIYQVATELVDTRVVLSSIESVHEVIVLIYNFKSNCRYLNRRFVAKIFGTVPKFPGNCLALIYNEGNFDL